MKWITQVRDFIAIWKLKIQRVTGYINLANAFMILFLFAKQLYEWPSIKNHFDFRSFIVLAYIFGILSFLLIAEVDWRFIFRREIGYQVSRNPIAVTECFRSAYILHKAKEEGKDVSEAFEKLRQAFYLAGYEKEFLEFWKIVEGGGEKSEEH